MRSLIHYSYTFLLLILLSSSYSSAQSVDDLTVLGVTLNPTFEHIAIHVNVLGDENRNSTLSIEYKLTGVANFETGSMTMRAHPSMIVDGSNLNMNFIAGSAMHLLPNTQYDLRLTLVDADGGGMVIDTSINTRKYPSLEQSKDTIYVVPGTSGGDGSLSSPYQGIQAAADVVIPGQIIEVADGTYDAFNLSQSGMDTLPIVIRSANLHGAIIDGNNTPRGVMTLGVFDDSLRHVIIEGFDIRNGKWGIDAQNTQYLTIRHNKIADVDYGIYNRRGNGWEHDQHIFNNEVRGRTIWPQLNGEIPGERGIDIRGNRNVVSYNTISNFGDGVSTDGAPYKVSYALDIHHNDITRIVDDLIEIDGAVSNTRVYKNRGFNGRMGVSVAPVFGGPAYIFRNEFYNLEYSSIKMNRAPTGLVIVNNTMVKRNLGLSSNVGWQNTVFKNNAVLCSQYVMEEYSLVNGSADDWNHNGYKSLRSGTSGGPWFKWDNIRYNNISAINSSGVTEENSIGINFVDFVDLIMPIAYGTEAYPSEHDMRLISSSSMIDHGVSIENILDLDSLTNSPDIGAYEYGVTSPQYGRDFNEVCEYEYGTTKTWTGANNIGWFHPNNWSPCGVPSTKHTVVIPGGLANYPFVNMDIYISDLILTGNGRLDITEEVHLNLR